MSPEPAAVSAPQHAVAVPDQVLYAASTGYVTCALMTCGSVSCFGSNHNGECGNGAVGGPETKYCGDSIGCNAVGVSAQISNVVELSGAGWWCGGSHFCARKGDGSVWCWGNFGSCNAAVAVTTPTQIPGIDGIVELTSGGAGFTCALRKDGTVWCWGANGGGALGQGDTNPYVGAVQVPGLSGATMIGSGLGQMCARAQDKVYCWGANAYAQAGVGPGDAGLADVLTPTLVTAPGFTDVVQVVGGQAGTCALTAAGKVFCWGSADLLGNGKVCGTSCLPGNVTAVPQQASISGVVEIAMGGDVIIARLASGALMAWGGDGSGEIGSVFATNPQETPIAVAGFP